MTKKSKANVNKNNASNAIIKIDGNGIGSSKLSKAFSTASILGSIVTIDSLFFSYRSDISLTIGLFSCTSAEICSVSVLIGNSDTLLIASFIC